MKFAIKASKIEQKIKFQNCKIIFPAFHLFLLEYGEEQYNLGRVLSYEEMRTESLPIWNHLKKGEREEYKKNSILKKDEILKKNQIIHQNDSKIAQKKREKAIAKDQFIKEYLATKVKGCEGNIQVEIELLHLLKNYYN